jgi:site-specific DNA-methyltransferase (adenine-specific)
MRNADQNSLFQKTHITPVVSKIINTNERLGRIDDNELLRERLLPYCRLKRGDVWEDNKSGHRVGALDATDIYDVARIMKDDKSSLALNDPPYNVMVGNSKSGNLSKVEIDKYITFSRKWVKNAVSFMNTNSHFYVWMGVDYKDNFQPLPDFMIMMREFNEDLQPRNYITVRNQRGYGTQLNWMWVRQELLYYIKGKPGFNVNAEYTDIPKILRGYYKIVNGENTENMERSKSKNIRAGNVWVDIQQVFYRLEENVPGCYAQKPLKSIERIIKASTTIGDTVSDFFSHSGTTLIAGERLNRRIITFDNDPIYAEITIRRLEHYRKKGKTGWQWHNPFPELDAK